MKVAITSDLHNEFDEWNPSNPENADVLILAGDIIPSKRLNQTSFIKKCSEEYNHVIYVAGNHEFYGSYIQKSLDKILNFCGEFKNVHFLENRTVDIGCVRFIGATLWTDLNNCDGLTEYKLKHSMNDYHKITYDLDGYRKLLPRDTYKMHKKSVKFIQESLNEIENQKVIVVTHHAPTFLSVPDQFKEDTIMNGGYCSNLSELILDNDKKIKYWIHGHCHSPSDYFVGETNVIANPRGYVGYERESEILEPYIPKVIEL